jgi:drug/metabolite transporter (DMT)-like permease|tara:strand:- start:292 stop:1152 length:861 start_codon:yes stop_codon:yes gene_type:complete
MNSIIKIPGPILIFLGACCLSFGGLIVKSFEGATLWQILFWRSIFFSIAIVIFLLITHKKNIFNSFYKSGFPGLIGGLILSLGYCGYVFAMYNTTVANTNFIIQTQTIFLAVFGYIFLKEKISKLTLFSIIFAFIGIILMVGNSLSPGQTSGNIAAFIMPISFATLILIVRKFPDIDMIPMQFVAGIGAIIIGYLFSTKLIISSHDIFLGFLAGFFQVGLGFIFITIGARSTPSALVGIIMLTEAVLGPLWAWLFANENPPLVVLIGGTIIISAVFLQLFNRKIIN